MEPATKLFPGQTAKKPREKLRILVVDDSKTARYAMRRHLESLNYEVQAVGSAHEAFSFLINHKPDAIFLDNVMPGVSGMEALNTLQRNRKTSKIPVIFCTSIDTDEFITSALEQGAREVLHKPPTAEVLAEVLGQIKFRYRNISDPTEPRHLATSKPAKITEQKKQELLVQEAYSPDNLQKQIDAAFNRIKNELSIQISELHAQLLSFETTRHTPQEIEDFRRVAREEAEVLNRDVKLEMEAIQRRLDAITMRQLNTMQQLLASKQEGPEH